MKVTTVSATNILITSDTPMTVTQSNPFKLNITSSVTGPFVAPYLVPTVPGQVVAIGGDGPVAIRASGGSSYPTNTITDIKNFESIGTQQLTGNDTGCCWMPSYSVAGAVGTAGGGGHKGLSNFGAYLFDFQDARWKRTWTHSGNPGVDNVTNEGPPPAEGGPPFVDIRTNTRVHNCVSWREELTEICDDGLDTSGWGSICFNSDHWTFTSAQLANIVRTPNPRDQTFEVSRHEPYPYSSTTVNGPGTLILSGPHGWLYPGESKFDHGGRFFFSGRHNMHFIGPSKRFDPTPRGTLEPTQSDLPVAAHIWGLHFELSPAQGGGVRGSIVCPRHMYGGMQGTTSMYWSHRYDVHKGIWHEWSVNNSRTMGADGSIQDTAAPGGAPWNVSGATSGCVDPVTNRYYMTGQFFDANDRINYINISDRQWRNMQVGKPTTSGRSESLMCDPVRRLLLCVTTTAPHIRVLDIKTLVGEPNPSSVPVAGRWKALSYTAAPGFTFGTASSTGNFSVPGGAPGRLEAMSQIPFEYCPLNGKYYRFLARLPGGNIISGNANVNYRMGTTQTVPAKIYYHGDELAQVHNKLQRLTPPPIIANPPDGYYYNSTNWVIDEIEVGAASMQPDSIAKYLPRGSITYSFQSVSNKWFKYIPALQCFAWFPLNNDNNEPAARRCVYLIKPY